MSPPRAISPESNHTFRHYSAHQNNTVIKPVRLHLPGSWTKCRSGEFQAGHAERFIHHSYIIASRCGRTFDTQAFALKEYKAPLFESSGQASYYLRKRYNPRFRRDIRWSATGSLGSRSGGRRGFCLPLQPEPFQFPSVQRESYRNAPQWEANASIWIHSKFCH